MEFNKYIGIYPTSGAVQSAIDEGQLHKPYIAIVQDGNYIDWNTYNNISTYSAMPLTIEITSGDSITWKRNGLSGFDYLSAPARTIEYSINEGEWNTITSNYNGVSFNVSSGDIIRFRGNSTTYGQINGRYGNTLIVNGYFKVYGNIASFFTPIDFINVNTIPGDAFIPFLFNNNTGLTDVIDLSFGNNDIGGLPKSYFFKSLFEGCSNLSFIKISTNFHYETSEGYLGRTYGENWVENVFPTGTFIKHPNMTSWSRGTSGIPEGWTVIDADL